MFCANVLVLSTTRRMFCFSTSGCQTTQPAAARAWVALYASTCLRGRCPNQRQVRSAGSMPQHPHLRDLCHDAFAIFPHDQIGEQRSLLPRSPTVGCNGCCW
jgi:hypothetical protein